MEGSSCGKSRWTKRRKIKANVEEHIREINIDTALLDQSHDLENHYTVAIGQMDNDQIIESLDSEAAEQSDNDQGDVIRADQAHNDSWDNTDMENSSDTDEECDTDEDFNYDNRFSDDDIGEDQNVELGILEELAYWAVCHKIPHTALSSLLELLRKYHQNLPKDPRTLLKTNTKFKSAIRHIQGGSYYHCGVLKGMEQIFRKYPSLVDECETIWLQINVDGLPLFKSSSVQFWPILGMIDKVFVREPFVIGLYCGCGKPVDIIEFLGEFISEMKSIGKKRFSFEGKHFTVKISNIICDAPARAFIKNCKSHNAYFGCEKCIQEGEWNRKMTFPEMDAPLRNDVQFSEMQEEDHHKGPSPLVELDIGLITQVPLDYMHLVCLGIMRLLLRLWTRGPLTCRIPGRVLDDISQIMINLRNWIPKEFARKPRSIKELDRWKATEFRQFLLYTGPLVLNEKLEKPYYEHFLLLSTAMHILLSPTLYRNYLSFAQDVLRLFVQDSNSSVW